MKRKELHHPRVFKDNEWALKYYNSNKKVIPWMGRNIISMLVKSGFKSGSILDAGCGFGGISIEIAKVFPKAVITGIDLGEPLLELGKSLAKDAGVAERITFKTGDAENINFKDNSFDVVVSTFLLHIVENPDLMLSEFERVAKPGAIIIIIDLIRMFFGIFMKPITSSYTYKEAKEIIRNSNIRQGKFNRGLFWLEYKAGI